MKDIKGIKFLEGGFRSFKLPDNIDVKVKIAAAIALIGILFALFTGVFGKAETAVKKDGGNAYVEMMTARLTEVIEKTAGAGKADVLLSYETDDITAGFGGVKKSGGTRIIGAAVVCAGGGDIYVKAKVTELVSKTLGLGASRVCVTD